MNERMNLQFVHHVQVGEDRDQKILYAEWDIKKCWSENTGIIFWSQTPEKSVFGSKLFPMRIFFVETTYTLLKSGGLKIVID